MEMMEYGFRFRRAESPSMVPSQTIDRRTSNVLASSPLRTLVVGQTVLVHNALACDENY